MFPKPSTWRSKKFLDFVRAQSCCVSRCQDDPDAHHWEAGGIGMKGSDYRTIPLCRENHAELHSVGRVTFATRYSVDVREVSLRLMEAYIASLEELDGRD